MRISFDPQVNSYTDFVSLAKKTFHADEIFYQLPSGGVIVWAISVENGSSVESRNFQTGHVTQTQVLTDFPSAVQLTNIPTFA